jgi:anti-sigma factor RsiW
MTENERISANGRSLWRRARLSPGDTAETTADLDPLDLAAYLDGRLTDEARARVEARLAESPELIDLLVASQQALQDGTLAPPEAVVRRAGALAGTTRAGGERRSRPAAPRPNAWGSRTLALSRGLAFASLAAAFLLVGAAGFELGRTEAAYSAQIDGLLAGEIGFTLGGLSEDLL